MVAQDELTKVFHALADPTRRALLDAIAREGDATVQELAKPFAISLPAVSKHIQVLEKAGLVRKSVDAQRRPCHLEAAPLKRATDWMQAYKQFWDERLDRLDDYLQQLQAKQKESGDAPHEG